MYHPAGALERLLGGPELREVAMRDQAVDHLVDALGQICDRQDGLKRAGNGTHKRAPRARARHCGETANRAGENLIGRWLVLRAVKSERFDKRSADRIDIDKPNHHSQPP